MRIETIGDATLYLGDCLQILPTLAAGSVDAVVTDPPYGVNFSSGRGGEFDTCEIIGDHSVSARDSALAIVSELPAVVFGSCKVERPRRVRAVLTWDKGGHVGMGDLSFPWKPNTEEIYIIGDGFSGRRRSSVLRYNAIAGTVAINSGRNHPTEKPVDLIIDLMQSTPGATILDPFMGSGTTGVAALRLGRKFIGIEIEPKYFDIACRRIEQENRQIKMF